MGLAGPKKKRKISNDPNNTAWSNDETSYGRKILGTYGWTPGSFLGAKDARHGDHFSAASASHIRVSLKDDNLGLGAKRTKPGDENFGIGTLQDIYGRLNGKEEAQIEKEQAVRAELGRRIYAQQRWGSSQWIRGGYLVGDKIEEVVEYNGDTQQVEAGAIEAVESMGKEEAQTVSSLHMNDTAKKSETKEERRHRKEERRKRKAEKLAKRTDGEEKMSTGRPSNPSTVTELVTPQGQESTKADLESEQTTANTPAVTQPDNRLAVRQRYIRQKRMAMSDPKALREILMLKA